MSWVSLKQNQTITLGTPSNLTAYTVEFTVTQANGIPPELFLFNTADDEFSSVALVRDIELWPTSKDEAVNKSLDFYRSATVIKVFTDKEKAVAFSTDIRRRLSAVNRDWNSNQSFNFGGQQIFVYSANGY